MPPGESPPPFTVTCRIGSLENKNAAVMKYIQVTCRIGSLENFNASSYVVPPVTCRIGSLEINTLIK